MDNIKQDYDQLLHRFRQEELEIDNLSELYTKFRNLKDYEHQYDRNEDLKKELEFWQASKTPAALELEKQIYVLEMQMKQRAI